MTARRDWGGRGFLISSSTTKIRRLVRSGWIISSILASLISSGRCAKTSRKSGSCKRSFSSADSGATTTCPLTSFDAKTSFVCARLGPARVVRPAASRAIFCVFTSASLNAPLHNGSSHRFISRAGPLRKRRIRCVYERGGDDELSGQLRSRVDPRTVEPHVALKLEDGATPVAQDRPQTSIAGGIVDVDHLTVDRPSAGTIEALDTDSAWILRRERVVGACQSLRRAAHGRIRIALRDACITYAAAHRGWIDILWDTARAEQPEQCPHRVGAMSQAENAAFAIVPRIASQVADKPSCPRTRARRIGIEVVSEKLAAGCICPRVEPLDLFLERRGAGLRERLIVFGEFRDECHSGE